MKSIKHTICIFCYLLCTSCNNDPDPCPEPELVDLRENFSEAEFENAIIGTWISAFEWEDKVNVMFLKVDCENRVEIHLEENGLSENYFGDLAVEYLRPASSNMITVYSGDAGSSSNLGIYPD